MLTMHGHTLSSLVVCLHPLVARSLAKTRVKLSVCIAPADQAGLRCIFNKTASERSDAGPWRGFAGSRPM